MDIRERFAKAQIVREAFPEFVDFAVEAMHFLGFNMTWLQCDIAMFMQHSPQNAMIQAQRGEAKSTIACLFAVWSIIQDPTTRVVLVSAATDKAEENGNLIYGLINRWPILDYLIPDKTAGDRTSITGFDVHWALKGIDKSPSVSCLGITSSLQGYRADLLIPDDIESTKNGLTAGQRSMLETLSKEFAAICADEAARILYLGTPQTKDSIYNGLERRGYEVRIWPGRYPSEELEEKYGNRLAPSIVERMAKLGAKCRTGGGLDGSLGAPTDPDRFNESQLCRKEQDYGPEGFMLQYMLNTELSDQARQQLKLKDLILADLDSLNVPEIITWAADNKTKIMLPDDHELPRAVLYGPAAMSDTTTRISNICMFVDPAGDGGDEIAFSIGGVVGPFIHWLAVGGYLHGFCEENLDALRDLAVEFNVSHVRVERNMGAGAITTLIRGHFAKDPRTQGIGIDESTATGQKERRIIDTVRPVLQRHRIIMHRRCLDMDHDLCQQHPAAKRNVRSVLFQMLNLTTDRGSLTKDDRVDAFAGMVAMLTQFLAIDETKAAEARAIQRVKDFLADPLGSSIHKQSGPQHKGYAIHKRAKTRRR